MIKSDIVKRVSERLGHTRACYRLSQDDINSIVTEVFNIIGEAFLEGESVTIRRFGQFSVSYRRPRKINHPATKQVINSHPKYMVKFNPSIALKKKLHVSPSDQTEGM